MVMARAIAAALEAPTFDRVADRDDAAWAVFKALCAALYPMSSIHAPSEHELERLAGQLVRDHEICRDFDGRNYDELARRYLITTRRRKRIRAGAPNKRMEAVSCFRCSIAACSGRPSVRSASS